MEGERLPTVDTLKMSLTRTLLLQMSRLFLLAIIIFLSKVFSSVISYLFAVWGLRTYDEEVLCKHGSQKLSMH